VGERSAAVAGRGENGLLLRIDSARRRYTGRRLHAMHVEAERQVARVRAVAGVVGTQHWWSTRSQNGSWCDRDAALAVGVGTRSERRPGARARPAV
jgi:hypothetical protein